VHPVRQEALLHQHQHQSIDRGLNAETPKRPTLSVMGLGFKDKYLFFALLCYGSLLCHLCLHKYGSDTDTSAEWSMQKFPDKMRQIAEREEADGRRSTDLFPGDPNTPTIALDFLFQVGLYNQQMCFTAAMMRIMEMCWNHKSTKNHTMQVLLPSLAFLDYLGSNKRIPFEKLFDVEHWNSFAPQLPRLVSYDQNQHYQFSRETLSFLPKYVGNYTHPQPLPRSNRLYEYYIKYLRRTDSEGSRLHPVDRLVLQEALRPHPSVQSFIDRTVGKFGGSTTMSSGPDYMALHARIEQDFLCYPFRPPVNRRNLTHIFERMEQMWPEPPASLCFIAVNRPLLETANIQLRNPKPSAEYCEQERMENLKALNHVIRNGLWGGRVRVFERPLFNASTTRPSLFRERPVTFAALMDSEICLAAKLFIGNLRSSFTVNIIRRRSIMNKDLENFVYYTSGDDDGVNNKLQKISGHGFNMYY